MTEAAELSVDGLLAALWTLGGSDLLLTPDQGSVLGDELAEAEDRGRVSVSFSGAIRTAA